MLLTGIVGRDELTVARLVQAVGVTLVDLRRAAARINAQGYAPPRRLAPTGDGDDPEVTEPVAPDKTSTATGRQAWNKIPEAETRECRHCHVVKPIGEFQQRTDADSRRTWCDDCRKADQRRRYLSVTKVRMMNAVGLSFVVAATDDIRGLVCVDCGRPIVVGEEVHGRAELRHTACPVRPMHLPEAHRPRVTVS